MTRSRLLTAVYLLGKRRAEAKAKGDLDDLAERFEEISEQTRAELRALRSEISRAHQIRRRPRDRAR